MFSENKLAKFFEMIKKALMDIFSLKQGTGNFRRKLASIDTFLIQWVPLLLFLFALIYYGQYYRTGLNLAGEGGTNAVLAMRLLEGQRPIVDTFLGYNLMWFYPIVAIFHFFGPDYIAMRIFFFAICFLTAFLGYRIVFECTSKAWLGLFASVFMVLVPGMIFRNYMGFIATFSMLVLLKGYVLPARNSNSQLLWMSGVGLALGLCFLIRIEPTLLISVVWLGLAFLYPLASEGDFRRRLYLTLSGTTMAAAMVLITHIPFLIYSEQAGFGKEFRGQYTAFTKLLYNELITEFIHIKETLDKPKELNQSLVSHSKNDSFGSSAAPIIQIPNQQSESVVQEGKDGRLGRPSLKHLGQIERPRERAFAVMIYYPVFLSLLLIVSASSVLIFSIVKNNKELKQSALIIFTSVGCSLSLFPQYFFFRPDAPHLSEFMVPYFPAIAVSGYCLWSFLKRNLLWTTRVSIYLILVFCILIVPIYMKAIMPRESAGTIFKTGKLANFKALNGVNVNVEENDLKQYEALRDFILQNSKGPDFLICYPYSPTINFFTNRRSYEFNLYIDNATAGSVFQSQAIERIKQYAPPLIIIDNWPINKTEMSRFMNWAKDLMNFINAEYQLYGVIKIGSRENFVYLKNFE